MSKIHLVRVSKGENYNHFNIRSDNLSELKHAFPGLTFKSVRKPRSTASLENSIDQVKRVLKGM